MATTAYFDANAVGNMVDLTDGVTPVMVEKIRRAVDAGSLVVPLSVATAEELLLPALHAGTGAAKAFQLGRSYLRFAFGAAFLKPSGQLASEACRAYAARRIEETAYERLGPPRRLRWQALSTGSATPADVQGLVGEAVGNKKEFHEFLRGAAETGRKAIRTGRRQGQRPTRSALWPNLSVHYAEGFAERAGVLRACRRRGIAGLLRRRSVLAAVGIAVELIFAQTLDGLRASEGDFYDMQHVVMAAAARGLFVTHDQRLRKHVGAIPGLKMEVVSVPELAARV